MPDNSIEYLIEKKRSLVDQIQNDMAIVYRAMEQYLISDIADIDYIEESQKLDIALEVVSVCPINP